MVCEVTLLILAHRHPFLVLQIVLESVSFEFITYTLLPIFWEGRQDYRNQSLLILSLFTYIFHLYYISDNVVLTVSTFLFFCVQSYYIYITINMSKTLPHCLDPEAEFRSDAKGWGIAQRAGTHVLYKAQSLIPGLLLYT